MSKGSIVSSDHTATARCGVQTERGTRIETRKMFSFRSDWPNKIMRWFSAPCPRRASGEEARSRMEHRHMGRGTWNCKGEGVYGISHSIKAGGNYTLSRSPDVDLGNLRSLTIGRGKCRPTSRSNDSNLVRAGRVRKRSLIRRSKSDAQARDRLSRCGETNTFAHALGLSPYTKFSADENCAH